MEEDKDLLSALPQDIKIDILSRLPLRSVARCKLLRKSWRSFIETPKFVKSYKSFSGLAVFQGELSKKPYKVYEFVDARNTEPYTNPWKEAFTFSFPQPGLIHSCVNGLLLFFDHKKRHPNLIICNPVTSECIIVPVPQVDSFGLRIELRAIGFGVSETTGKYKLLRIFHEVKQTGNPGVLEQDRRSRFEVYTLGTGSWRSIVSDSIPLVHDLHSIGVCVNGNLHWLACYNNDSIWISRFDLEKERFCVFETPRLGAHPGRKNFRTLSALWDRLAICDDSADHTTVIWLMHHYGFESWTKQFELARTYPRGDFVGLMYAIKVFENRNILIRKEDCPQICCYSHATGTIQVTDLIEANCFGRCSAVCYSPSFLPLKTFPMENVISF